MREVMINKGAAFGARKAGLKAVMNKCMFRVKQTRGWKPDNAR